MDISVEDDSKSYLKVKTKNVELKWQLLNEIKSEMLKEGDILANVKYTFWVMIDCPVQKL